jgi:uncharacterized protein (DUF4415 family)
MSENGKNTKSEWVDPDDAPELTDEFFETAEIAIGDKVIRPATGKLTKDGVVRTEHYTIPRPGRPPERGRAKQQVTLRLDPDVIARFKRGGAGWQTRMNEALRKAAGL